MAYVYSPQKPDGKERPHALSGAFHSTALHLYFHTEEHTDGHTPVEEARAVRERPAVRRPLLGRLFRLPARIREW